MSDVQVAVGYTIRPWRSELQRHARDFVTGVEIQVYRDHRALKAAHFDALLLDGSSSLLDASLMMHCADRQIPVAAVYTPEDDADGSELARVEALGVSIVDPSALDDLLTTFSRRGPVEPGASTRTELPPPQADLPVRTGQVIAVGGPGGAGTTEVAVGLATAASQKGRTILVDVDEMRPTVARRLGLTLTPHIVNAVDDVSYLARSATTADLDARVAAVTARPAVANPKGLPFDVIVGLPSSAEWQSLQPERVIDLLLILRRLYATVILRLGPSLEDLTRWVDRFGVSRACAADADRVVSVADGSPSGVAESVDWIAELREVTQTPVDLVVNRVPSGRYRRAEMTEVLEAAVGASVASVHSVRYDKTVPDRSWFGDLPRKGTAFKDISAIADAIVASQPEPPTVPSDAAATGTGASGATASAEDGPDPTPEPDVTAAL